MTSQKQTPTLQLSPPFQQTTQNPTQLGVNDRSNGRAYHGSNALVMEVGVEANAQEIVCALSKRRILVVGKPQPLCEYLCLSSLMRERLIGRMIVAWFQMACFVPV